MILQTVSFYTFSSLLVISAFLVISTKNPVHSVLFLVLGFISSAGLFVLVGAEFLAMILIIVYVGAVAVLFLFVVMMLDINFVKLREGFLQYLPVGLLVGLLLLLELILVVGTINSSPVNIIVSAPTPLISEVSNTQALGSILYTRYIYLFQAAGMILLVGMIGAIVLTHRSRNRLRKQSIYSQVNRKRSESVELKKVKSGEGL